MIQKECSSICAIILAAGSSTRFGPDNKLMVKVDGVPIVERIVKVIVECGVSKTMVVTGADHSELASLLDGYAVDILQNREWNQGMGKSLAFGVCAIPDENYSGIMVCLGDLPSLDVLVVRRILAEFEKLYGKQIVVPSYRGLRGHPVIFPIAYRSELMEVVGDNGAKNIINRDSDLVKIIDVDSSAVIRDIDKRSDLECL